MGRRLLTEYIQEFRRHESEVAYAHRRGYRLLRWTYGEVASAAARFARLLESRGVGKGDRVLLAGGDLAEWAAVFWGCLLRGAAVVPLEREIRKYLKYERPFHPLRFLNLLPLSHVFGQFMGLFVPPLLSATVIFLDTLNPSEVLRTIRNERVSVLVTVPRVLETLRDKFERDFQSAGKIDEFGRRLKAAEGRHFTRRWWMFRDLHRRLGWKFWALVSGGAALDCEPETLWKRLGFAVIQGYGLTE